MPGNGWGGKRARLNILDIFKIEREGEEDAHSSRFGKLGNRLALFHATNIAVVSAILKSGLRIMPHSGGELERGRRQTFFVDVSARTFSVFIGRRLLIAASFHRSSAIDVDISPAIDLDISPTPSRRP